jgi:hypothetical protein
MWYGYQWRVKYFIVHSQEVESYYAMGYGGIFLFVFPELDMIVGFTAQNFESGWATNFFNMLEEYILPAAMK